MRKILDGIKNLFSSKSQPEQKSWWTPYYGSGFGNTYDAFGGQKEPGKADLVKAYDDITYACVSLIAQNIAHVPIRLYVKTGTGQRQPKCATRPASKSVRQKFMGTDVREVTEHPLLSLLSCCNAYHNKVDLMELTEIYLDLTGNSYWLMQNNNFGIPEQLYLLPSHLIQPEYDSNGFVRDWILHQGVSQKRYSISEVIHFKYANPLDPYGEGLSPLRGAWGRHQISSKELSYLDNYLSSQGRPDAVLAIKDSISPLEAERIAKEFRHRYQGQGAGGLLVVDGTMNLMPLNFPAKDLAELQVYQVLKTVICNCFHIPPDIFELGTSSNRSTREAAIYSFAHDCLTPRMQGIVQRLNDKLVPFFDERLFFDFDPIVKDDQQHELAVTQLLTTQQAITRNELRARYGYGPEEWADEPLLPSGVMPADAFSAPAHDDQGGGVELLPAEPEPKDRTAQGAAILALQQAVYAGQLPREAAISQCTIIYGFTPEEADSLFPAPAGPPEGTQPAGPPDTSPGPAPAPDGPPDDDQGGDDLPDDQNNEKQPASKATRTKAIRQLAPGPLIKALQVFFRKLAGSVEAKLKTLDGATTKSVAILDWFNLDTWTTAMAEEMRPVLAAYYDHASRETVATLNLASSLFHTVQPKLREGVDKAAMVFCEDTLATTKQDLDSAMVALRKEITEGLEVGDVKNEMMKRVQKVFTEAETERAFRIGATEASRGQHNAMMITAKESGVVTGKTWLLSDDACPICKPLANKTVGLDDAFTTDGTGPYARIEAPPRHPYCRCNLLLETGD